MSEIKNILITGAAGKIGQVLRTGLREKYNLRLADIVEIETPFENEEFVACDVTNFDAFEKAARDMDAVIHLAAIPDEQPWDVIFPQNFTGTYNAYEAARINKIKRFVYASSIHAVGFYRRDQVIDVDVMPRPSGFYGVSKIFGESMGRLYADKHGLSVVCLRINTFWPEPENERELTTWLSHRDGLHLFERALETPDIHFTIAYGVSNNTRRRADNSKSLLTGYQPQDDAEDHIEKFTPFPPEDEISKQFHGGYFCSIDFDGDVSKIE